MYSPFALVMAAIKANMSTILQRAHAVQSPSASSVAKVRYPVCQPLGASPRFSTINRGLAPNLHFPKASRSSGGHGDEVFGEGEDFVGQRLRGGECV